MNIHGPDRRPVSQKLIKVRRLEAHDVTSYRELRLEGLKSHPEAFASAWEDEAGKPASWWTERLETSVVFGGWIDDSPRWVSPVNSRVNTATKLLWWQGVLVRRQVARPHARAARSRSGLVGAAGDRANARTPPLSEPPLTPACRFE
jgi:hypothetical protein